MTGEYEAREEEEEGRRFNLATRVMSNGVEVIVAGPTPALRWENSHPQPTLTLSDAMVMLLPQDKPNEFVTKTCTTTFTYLSTITKDGTTTVSTEQQVLTQIYPHTHFLQTKYLPFKHVVLLCAVCDSSTRNNLRSIEVVDALLSITIEKHLRISKYLRYCY